MAGSGITVKVDDRQVQELLQAMLKRMGSLRPAMEAIGETLVSATHDRFEKTESPEGKKWKPVSPAYAEWKEKIGKDPAHILRLKTASGLLGSINYRATDSKVTVGTNVVYAAIHQFGGPTKRGATMPARPYLGVSDDDLREIREMLQEYLMTGRS